LKEQLKAAQNNVAVEVQCDLANQAHDMLMGKYNVIDLFF